MTKSQEYKQELAMLDLEIAALKMDVLVQSEIAKNNKDAYDKLMLINNDSNNKVSF